VLPQGPRVVGRAGELPGDAGEAGGEGILRRVRDADEQGSRPDAVGQVAGDVGPEHVGSQEAAELVELFSGGCKPGRASQVPPGIEGSGPPGGRVCAQIDLVRGEVAPIPIGETQHDAPGGGIGQDVEGEEGHGRFPEPGG
jgi:hypothetical protein